VIQGFRQPAHQPLQVRSARRADGKVGIHGPCSGRHFSIGPASTNANRYLHRLRCRREVPDLGVVRTAGQGALGGSGSVP
jgi:hypothetical protein